MSQIPPEHPAARSLEVAFRRLGEERSPQRSSRRPRVVRRASVAAVGAVLVVAAGATGTKVFLADGGSVGSAGRYPADWRPAPANRHLAQATVRDPVDPIPWGMRVYTGSRGATCLLVGRVAGARLGIVQDGRFAELASGAPGTCDDLGRRHAFFGLRDYGERTATGGRTVLYGIADRTISTVTLTTPSATPRPLAIAPDGTFIMVLKGPNTLRHAQLVLRGTHGRTVRALGG
jgi:hypothetical protein